MRVRVAGCRMDGKQVWYTGRAGQDFVSTDRKQAFDGFDAIGAQRKADALNAMSEVHGITFFAEAQDKQVQS